jgi:lactosylceramide 4-alpha-galactosyltransferase
MVLLARMNPDMDVYLFLATTDAEVTLQPTPLLDVLLSYPNIRIRSVNTAEITKGTAINATFLNDVVGKSKFHLEHTSDILRVVTLSKYGGLYLDLDVISLTPVRMLNRKNFFCLQNEKEICNAIIRLERSDEARFLSAYLE